MVILLQFILAIAALIVVHELGHFLAARAVGIPVEEFGIGFPPRMLRLFRWRETEFTLNWIPLGGFVRPAGETDEGVPNGLAAAPPWKRIFVLLAGPAANILLAIALYALIFGQLGAPDLERVQVLAVESGSPADEAGLQEGDNILFVGDEAVDSTQELHDVIYANLGEPIEITFERGGRESTVELIPRDPPPETGAIGISMGHPRIPISSLESVSHGATAVREQVNALASLPGQLLSGDADPEEGRLVGYKGMYDIFSEVRSADVSAGGELPPGINTFAFLAAISTSLAVLNLLPVPALDGGRILFTLPELITGRRIPQEVENAVNLVGLGALLLLMIYINLQDFLNPVVLP